MFELIRKIKFKVIPYKRVLNGVDYNFLCQNPACKLQFKKNIPYFTTSFQCPICLAKSHRIISGGIGAHAKLDGSKGSGGFQFNIDKPRPLEECERDIRILEQSGKMGPNERIAATKLLAGLRKEKQLGHLDEKIDYQVDGHPIERD